MGYVRYLFVCLLLLLGTVVGISGKDQESEAAKLARLEAMVTQFRDRLGIPEQVLVSIVDANKHLVSVQRSPTQKTAFIIKIERSFLATLNEDELCAVMAHEMGHVWIFTHHPYLQTEALANEKALQLVERESLVQVYEKVWRHSGKKGTLEEFLAIVQPHTSDSIATVSSTQQQNSPASVGSQP